MIINRYVDHFKNQYIRINSFWEGKEEKKKNQTKEARREFYIRAHIITGVTNAFLIENVNKSRNVIY